MSIKESLEAFVAHVQSMREEDETGEDGYTKEFQMLKQQSNQYRVEGTFPTTEGEKEYNRRKNRYKDILPFDYTRVVLSPIPGLPGSDYINANFIKGATGHQSYIAAQGPLPFTVADFWRLVWENKVQVLIMTANEYEGGKMKCACYWPKTSEERQYGDISVTLVDEKERGSKDFIVRQLLAKCGDEARLLTQLHYIAWPDHAVPISLKPLIDMVALARDLQPEDQPPLLIHCSAGCGRTGTLCAIDYAWTLLKMGQINTDFSLYDIIYEMRRQRPSSVQALDQYILAHHAVAQLFSRHLELINQHYNLPDDHVLCTLETTNRAQTESPYENITPLPAFLESTLDKAGLLLDGTNEPNDKDFVGKEIRETVKRLINKPGVQLIPPVGQKSTDLNRQLPSPRIRAKKIDVENGYAHIQLKNPLPIPRKTRMERNSSSSSSRSSTSSVSGTQTDGTREPIKSEPDYEVLSRFQSGDPSSSTCTGSGPALVVSTSNESSYVNHSDNIHSQSHSLDYDNTSFVFSPPGTISLPQEKELSTLRQSMIDQPSASVSDEALDESPMIRSDYSMRSDLSGSSDPRLKHPACSPRLSPNEVSDGHVKMEQSEEATRQAGSSECILFEDNVLYEQSSASVREKWPICRGFSPPDSRTFQPGTLPLFPINVHTDSGHHNQGAPSKSPTISQENSMATWCAGRSPEVGEGIRKPLPLPKPKVSPTYATPAEATNSSSESQGPSDMYAIPDRKSSALSPSQPSAYSYADPSALGKWSLQHVARGVPFEAVLEDGDYAELKNPARSAFSPPDGQQPALPPRSTSISHYEDVQNATTGEYSVAYAERSVSLSDEEGPQVPPKTPAAYQEPGEDEDDSITGQMSRSLDTLSDTVTTGVLTFGRKLKQKVQQTFGKTPGSPPEGLMLGSPPGANAQGQSQDPGVTKSMSIFYKGMDISFPHRVPRPQGPRMPNDMTSPNENSRNLQSRH